ncbi:hypothetical protein Q5P01_000226 [Channa striata]|uniref:Uncharacterized protein n=1 Tax=Channa striata TaxID=64152 RepID=A0AA88LID7_CHASR|nr:hypothetical protein Q5P01_000226 [Channa striata]
MSETRFDRRIGFDRVSLQSALAWRVRSAREDRGAAWERDGSFFFQSVHRTSRWSLFESPTNSERLVTPPDAGRVERTVDRNSFLLPKTGVKLDYVSKIKSNARFLEKQRSRHDRTAAEPSAEEERGCCHSSSANPTSLRAEPGADLKDALPEVMYQENYSADLNLMDYLRRSNQASAQCARCVARRALAG